MSASFLTTSPGISDLKVAVEIAWGADITDLDGSGWTWVDITEHVLTLGGTAGTQVGGQGIVITLGRPDFSQETQAAELTLQLDNRDGRYSMDGLGANWPNVKRGVPVRVRVSPDGGTTWSLRFQGQSVGFTPAWDAETGRWATVTLSASGPLRRLNQGTGVNISAMYEGTLADSSVVAYLPCTDRQHSTFVAPAIGGAPGLFTVVDQESDEIIPGVPGECASYSDIPSSAPLLQIAEGGGVTWNVTDTTGNSATVTGIFSNVAQLKARQQPNESPDDTYLHNQYGTQQIGNILTVFTSGASRVKAWVLNYWTELPPRFSTPVVGALWLAAYDTLPFAHGSDMVVDQKTRFVLLENTPYEFGLSLSQSGSTTTYRLFTREIGTDSERVRNGGPFSVSSNSNGAQVSEIQSATNGDSPGLVVGHLVLRNTIATGHTDQDWSNGYPGEGVLDRLDRLCSTHGIQLDVLNSTIGRNDSITDAMGPQYYDTLTNLLRECEVTGQGLLYDGIGPGLTYVARGYRAEAANGPATLTLDASAGQMMEPFTPVDDDQLTVNHMDVTRRGGTSDTWSDLDGTMGVNAIGDFSNSITPNTETDDGLVRYAQWMVGIGTQQGYRYPTVTFALETNPDLIEGWLACRPQSRIDVENVATVRRQHSPETIHLLLEGWQEEISAFTWRVTANTSSAAPWNVIRAAAATGSTGDGVCHLHTDSSQLTANAAVGATSISVKTNSGPRWVTAGDTTQGGSDNFPFDLDVGGCKVTVTAVSGTTSPQTFTLSTPLPRAMTGSTTAGSGTPVKVWRPPVLGL